MENAEERTGGWKKMVKTVKWKIWKKREGKKQFIQSFQGSCSGSGKKKNADKERFRGYLEILERKNLQTFHKAKKQIT